LLKGEHSYDTLLSSAKKVERNNIRAGGQGELDKTLASKYSFLSWHQELITIGNI
jgi:hypothetical protein